MLYNEETVGVICSESSPNKEYLRSMQLCWDKAYYAHQRMALMQFMALQAQNKVAPHVTVEDMKQWLTSQAGGSFRERFQREITKGRDLCIAELAWAVNTRLKLHEMERELGQGGMFSLQSVDLHNGDILSTKLLHGLGESQSSSLSPCNLSINLASGESSVVLRKPVDSEVNSLVQKALEDIHCDLTYLPASQQQSAAEVVIDLVTNLLLSIATNTAHKESSDGSSPSMPLVDLMMWVVMSVLMDLSGALHFTDAFNHTKHLTVYYSKPVGIKTVRSMLDYLLDVAGGPAALREALDAGDGLIISTILRGIMLNVHQLMKWDRKGPLDMTEPSTCANSCLVQNLDTESSLGRQFPMLHGEIPVIHFATLNNIVDKLLGQIFFDAPNKDATFLLWDWPLLADLENHLSAVIGMSVSRGKREANVYLEPADVQQIVDSVYNKLAQGSESKMILQTIVSFRNQMVSRDITCLIVRAMMKLLPSVYSGGYAVKPDDCGEHCIVHEQKAENYWALVSTGTVPDALLLHIIDRLVCNIFPMDSAMQVLGEDMRKHFCLSQQLWIVIQDKLAKAPKSRALLRALKKLPASEQSLGNMHFELGDMLYSEYTEAFPSKQHIDIDGFIEDKELCFHVSSMVVEKLLNDWTPSVRFSFNYESDPLSPVGARSEVVGQRATFGVSFPDVHTFGKVVTTQEKQSLSTKADKKSSKKGIRGFLRKVWRTICGCGRAAPGLD